MKKILIIMTLLMLALPTITGLLMYKSPVLLRQYEKSEKIIYFETKTGQLKECDLEEYLIGVLAAEMPAEYHKEALKAQAVAARSFVKKQAENTNKDHPGAVVCDNPNHCKAHLDERSAKAKWASKNAEKYWQKLSLAVDETCGEYMLCEGEVVEAFFFARSNGKTENSEDVWGEERAYLKSVDSAGDKTHPEYESELRLSAEAARKHLKALNPGMPAGNEPLSVGEVRYTQGGNVATIEIDGLEFRGKDIRGALDLKSAAFAIETDADGGVVFRVFGYGHGVGMSQFGANCMAQSGKNYTEILKHYYTNIQIIKT